MSTYVLKYCESGGPPTVSTCVFCRTRETANMEYIKNIVLHYMCTNSAGREQMTSAIATALHFSEDEVSVVYLTFTSDSVCVCTYSKYYAPLASYMHSVMPLLPHVCMDVYPYACLVCLALFSSSPVPI